MARKFAKPFYNSKEWEHVRKAVLMRDNYLCTKCGKPAEEVHHIIHLTPENIGDISVTMNMNNLTSLCRDCHMELHKHERIQARHQDNYAYEFDENGMLKIKS